MAAAAAARREGGDGPPVEVAAVGAFVRSLRERDGGVAWRRQRPKTERVPTYIAVVNTTRQSAAHRRRRAADGATVAPISR